MSTFSKSTPGVIGAGLTVAMLCTFVATPAQAADPAVFCDVPGQELAISPVADLVEGEEVTWKSTVKGQDPTDFTGEYIGKIDNALGYDSTGEPRDLLLVRLQGQQVDGDPDTKTLPAGVWAGASGSPVYDDDGALIGAVSYGFSEEADNVAGVTPAAYMRKIGDIPGKVSVNRSAKLAIAESTGETPSEPLRRIKSAKISFNDFSARAAKATKQLEQRIPGFRDVKPGGLSVNGGKFDGESMGIVAGGNLAVTYAYGAVGDAGVGTVTAVCGDEVFAFGHPNNWDSSMIASFHGASAARIMPSGGNSYKQVSAIGKPMGVVTDDRLAGIKGTLEEYADTVPVTTVSKIGSQSSTATSHVSERYAIAGAVYEQLLQDASRALDNTHVGSATVTWSIDYVRENGRTGTLKNKNKYTEIELFPEHVGEEVASDVSEIVANEFEDVKITAVKATADFSDEYRASRLTGVQMKKNGKWKNLKSKSTTKVSRGKTYKFRAVLSPAPRSEKKTEYKEFTVRVPKNTKKTFSVRLHGESGSSVSFFDDLFENPVATTDVNSFAGLIKALDNNDRNDRIDLTQTYRNTKGLKVVKKKSPVVPRIVVAGDFSFKLQAPVLKKKKKR